MPDHAGDFPVRSHERRIAVDQLTLDLSTLARSLGYRAPADCTAEEPRLATDQRHMPAQVARVAEAMLAKAGALLEPRWCWVPVPAALEVERDALVCLPPSARTLLVGELVRVQLLRSRAVAVFVVTIGSRLEDEARSMMATGDQLEGYVLDTVGSMSVEAAADVLEADVLAVAAERGWKITNRVSPGYCTWATSGQQDLFSLLPDQPAGVTLNPSSLMHPIKSISGVIGMGADVEHRPYPCAVCKLKSCRRRLTESRL